MTQYGATSKSIDEETGGGDDDGHDVSESVRNDGNHNNERGNTKANTRVILQQQQEQQQTTQDDPPGNILRRGTPIRARTRPRGTVEWVGGVNRSVDDDDPAPLVSAQLVDDDRLRRELLDDITTVSAHLVTDQQHNDNDEEWERKKKKQQQRYCCFICGILVLAVVLVGVAVGLVLNASNRTNEEDQATMQIGETTEEPSTSLAPSNTPSSVPPSDQPSLAPSATRDNRFCEQAYKIDAYVESQDVEELGPSGPRVSCSEQEIVLPSGQYYFFVGTGLAIGGKLDVNGWGSYGSSPLRVLSGMDEDDCSDLECVNNAQQATASSLHPDGSYYVTWYFMFSTLRHRRYYLYVEDLSPNQTFSVSLESSNDVCNEYSWVGPPAIPLLDPTSEGRAYVGTTISATIDIDVPSCDGVGTPDAPGVWYEFRGESNFSYALSTCEPSGSPDDIPTTIAVYEGFCGSLTCVAVSTGNCTTQNWLSWSGADTFYSVLVYGSKANTTGDFLLVARQGAPNDVCEGATQVVLDPPNKINSSERFVANASTLGALPDEVDMRPSCGNSAINDVAPGIWYNITGIDAEFQVQVNIPNSSDLQLQYSLYQGGDCESQICVEPVFGFVGEYRWDGRSRSGTDFVTLSASWFGSAGLSYLLVVRTYDDYTGTPRADSDAFGIEIGLAGDSCHNAKNNPLFADGSVRQSSTRSANADPGVDLCFGPSAIPIVSGVFYTFYGTGALTTVSTCHNATNFDAHITILQGTCGALSCLASTLNAESNASSCGGSVGYSVSLAASSGELYYVYVHGIEFMSSGDFGLSLSVETTEPCQLNGVMDLGLDSADWNLRLYGTTLIPNAVASEGLSGLWFRLGENPSGKHVEARVEASFVVDIIVLSTSCLNASPTFELHSFGTGLNGGAIISSAIKLEGENDDKFLLLRGSAGKEGNLVLSTAYSIL